MDHLRRCPECGSELLPDDGPCSLCHAERSDGAKGAPDVRTRDLSVLKVLGVFALLVLATLLASVTLQGIYHAPPESKIVLSEGSWDNYTGMLPPTGKVYVIVQVTVTSELDEPVTLFIDMFRLRMQSGVDYGPFPGIKGNFTGEISPGQRVSMLIGFSIDDGEVPDALTFKGLGQSTDIKLVKAEL
ncbi:MAG: hypothetical protein HPY73_01410 [Methanomassiliicoccales archaeon]|nr:MAG: hypothetical protein HPY73_01410 [Methanomassiliicoccales archaeon]